MQALYTHLEQPFTQGPPKGISVQGLNTLFQGESSFEKLLKQTAYSQDLKAMEGPPEQTSVRILQTEERSRETAEPASAQESKADSSSAEKNAVHNADKTAAEPAVENERHSAADETEKSALKESVSEEHADGKSPLRAGRSGKTSRLGSGKAGEAELAEKAAKTAQAQNKGEGGEEGEDALLAAADAAQTDKTVVLRSENLEFDADEKAETESVPDWEHEALTVSFIQGADTRSVKAGRKEDALSQKARENQEFSVQSAQNAQNVKREAYLSEIPSVIVRDERTKAPHSAEDKKQSLSASIRYDGKGSAQADLFLNAPDASKAGTAFPAGVKDGILSSRAPEQAQAQARFTSMLSAEIRANAADLVKAGSIVLRDGNKGTINLTLHPEELGNVKIRLQISDNILTGRITVASEEAYNAFKSNIAALTEAFASNGFDTAGFDLSWSGQNDGRHDGNADTRNPFAFRYDEQTAFAVEDNDSEALFRYDARPSVNLIA